MPATGAAGTRSMGRLSRLDDTRSTPPTRDLDREDKARARESDRVLKDVFEQGRSEGRRQARRRPAARRAPSLRREVRQATAPLRAPGREGMRITVMILGLTLVYLVLDNAAAASGALNGVRRALVWLRNPAAVIPYAASREA